MEMERGSRWTEKERQRLRKAKTNTFCVSCIQVRWFLFYIFWSARSTEQVTPDTRDRKCSANRPDQDTRKDENLRNVLECSSKMPRGEGTSGGTITPTTEF